MNFDESARVIKDGMKEADSKLSYLEERLDGIENRMNLMDKKLDQLILAVQHLKMRP